MQTLRDICSLLGHQGTVTYIQSGNAVFRTEERDLAKLAAGLENAVYAECGFRPAASLRTVSDLRAVVASNPFGHRDDLIHSRLLVTFLCRDPGDAARHAVRAIDASPEELHVIGSEIYTCYVAGIGKSKLNGKAVERAIGCAGTARNWTTVLKLLEVAEALEAGG